MRRDFERGVYEREEAESESRCDALHRNPLDSNDLRAWRHLAYKLEHQYALAQTEIKGHMRIEDDLKAELHQVKALMQPGQIDAVMQGIRQRDERLAEAQARIAELEKDTERYRMLHNGDVDGILIMRGHVEDEEDIANLVDGDELDAAIDAALKDRA
jgi:hypothetical protein